MEITFREFLRKQKRVNIFLEVFGHDLEPGRITPSKLPAEVMDYNVVPLSMTITAKFALLRAFIKTKDLCFAGPVTSTAAMQILESMTLEAPINFKGLSASSSPKPGHRSLVYLYGQLKNPKDLTRDEFYGDYPTEEDFKPAKVFIKPRPKRTLLPNPASTSEKRLKAE